MSNLKQYLCLLIYSFIHRRVPTIMCCFCGCNIAIKLTATTTNLDGDMFCLLSSFFLQVITFHLFVLSVTLRSLKPGQLVLELIAN